VARWLVGLPFSIALHLALAVAAIVLLRVEPTPTGLIVDLSAIVAGREDGSPPGKGTPAPPPVTGASAQGRAAPPSARATPSHVSRESALPFATPPSTDTTPARRQDAAPSRGPEIVPPPSAAPSNDSASVALTTTPEGASAAGRSVQRDESGGAATPRADGPARVGGETESGARGPGGVGGDRIAALGIPGGGGAGSDYAAYFARLRQRIQEVLRYPAVARRRGFTGTVHLEIDVEPDGAIATVSVIASSSHEILDRAAVDAARSIPRLPFPSDVRPRPLRVRLPVVFELQ
jgi:protein TonB